MSSAKIYQQFYFEKGRKKRSSDEVWADSLNESRGVACKLATERRIASVESISKTLKKKWKHPVPGNARYVEIMREKENPKDRLELVLKPLGSVIFIPFRGFWWMTMKNGKIVFYPITENGRIKGKPVRRLI